MSSHHWIQLASINFHGFRRALFSSCSCSDRSSCSFSMALSNASDYQRSKVVSFAGKQKGETTDGRLKCVELNGLLKLKPTLR